MCWKGLQELYDESYKGGWKGYNMTARSDMDDLCYENAELMPRYFQLDWVIDALDTPEGQGRVCKFLSCMGCPDLW